LDAAQQLREADVEQPWREALAIWAALRGSSPGTEWLRRTIPARAEDVHRFRRAVLQRTSGVPRGYAVGLAGFRKLDLWVDPRVLIPRPETEGLVDHVLAWARWRADGALHWGTVADLGTGSGAIALALATEGSFDRVVATDISGDALDVARRNITRVLPETPVEVRLGSWLEALAGERFGILVSNPPYVSPAEYAELDASVREHEPQLALVSDESGLAATHHLLERSGDHLLPGGLLALELDCRRAEVTLALARDLGWSGRVAPDVFGRSRYLLATRES